ncbi:MAG: hypothetical protein ABIQ18_02615 [Umezawaea sp.]
MLLGQADPAHHRSVCEGDRYIVVVLTSHAEKSPWAAATTTVTKIALRALVGR